LVISGHPGKTHLGYIRGRPSQIGRRGNCDADTIKATAANVLRTAHALAEAITTTEEEAEAA
jgi:hypothetical protein